MCQEDDTLQDISIDCSYYSASLLKEECCNLLPLPCSYSHLFPVLSQLGNRGYSDARSHRLVIPSLAHPESGLPFSERDGFRGRWGSCYKGSFSLMNTVTQLPVKQVTSCKQTVPLLSTSVPPPRRRDYVTGTLVI